MTESDLKIADPHIIPFKMKQTERQHIQDSIDEVLTQLEDETPSEDISRTRRNLVEDDAMARKIVAHDEMRKRAALRAERLAKDATTDPLTGLLNRRGFEKEYQKLLSIMKRTGGTVHFGVFDLNNLKLVNDNEGHEAGDRAIQSAGEVLSSDDRPEDLTARTGGDEFLKAWSNLGEDGIAAVWQRKEQEFKNRGLAISAGIASVDIESPERARVLADQAQYYSKLLKGDGRSHLSIVTNDDNFEEFNPPTLLHEPQQEKPTLLHQEKEEVA